MTVLPSSCLQLVIQITQLSLFPFRTVFQFGKAEWDGFRCVLADVLCSLVPSLGPDLAADELSLGMEIYIPSRTYQIKAHSQTWYTPACATAIAHRNHFLRNIIFQELWIVSVFSMKLEIDVREF